MTRAFGMAFIAGALAAAQTPAITIFVIEGEDAVNIIQQKSAVAPAVEVRDRNDQPVAGAVVSFAIRGGRAPFGGARTLAVTTDIAGRALAAGLAPTASGGAIVGRFTMTWRSALNASSGTASVTLARVSP